MKKFFTLFVVSFFFALCSYSQTITVTVGTGSVNQGDTILIPVTGTNVNTIGALGFFIPFDNTKLKFDTVWNIHSKLVDMLMYFYDESSMSLGFAWSASKLTNIGTAKLFDIKFTQLSGSTDLCIDPASSFFTNFTTEQPISTNWVCGKVDVITGVKEYQAAVNNGIYPNPSNGKFTVNLKKGDKELSIYNLSGEMVYSYKLDASVNNSLAINVTGLSKGLYIVKIAGNSQNNYKKIVIN